MWKNLITFLALAVLIIAPNPVAAQANYSNLPPVSPMAAAAPLAALSLPGSGWWSGFQVVNIGTGDATVQVTLYDSKSSATYQSVSKTIIKNQSYTFATITASDWQTTIPSGFIGSGVINSTQPILAVSNIQNNQSPTNGIAAASFSAIPAAKTSSTFLFPVAKAGFGSTNKTTSFFIQNTSGSAADISVVFHITSNGGGTYNHTYSSVGAYQLQVVEPADAGVPAASLGSATISSNAQLAGMYIEHETGVTTATTASATSGFNTATDGDTTIYIPLYLQNVNNTYSGIQVMNTSTTDSSTFTATFYPADGSGPYPGTSGATPIAPQGSFTFFNVSGWPATTGAVVIQSSGSAVPIIAIVNETLYSVSSNAVYSAFANKNLTHCAYAPLWKTDWSGATTFQQTMLVVQNASGTPATVHAVFTMTSGGTGTFTPADRTVAAYNETSYGPAAFAGGPPSTTPAVGSVTICADQNIAVMAQENTLAGHPVRDLLEYEAFNQ